MQTFLTFKCSETFHLILQRFVQSATSISYCPSYLKKMAGNLTFPTPLTVLYEVDLYKFDCDRSIRITARLDKHDCSNCTAVLHDPSSRITITVDTTLVEPFDAHLGSLFQVIGDLEATGQRNKILKARVMRCVDGIDLVLYRKATSVMRNHLSS